MVRDTGVDSNSKGAGCASAAVLPSTATNSGARTRRDICTSFHEHRHAWLPVLSGKMRAMDRLRRPERPHAADGSTSRASVTL